MCLLGATGTHSSNGFPTNPFLHMHCGTWLITAQSVFRPQVPGTQGLTHFRLMHARSRTHSELLTHSGLHPRVGSPWYPGRQVQMQFGPTALWLVLGPQGFGVHGLEGCSGSVTTPSVVVTKGDILTKTATTYVHMYEKSIWSKD
jgi:hypothetical protein